MHSNLLMHLSFSDKVAFFCRAIGNNTHWRLHATARRRRWSTELRIRTPGSREGVFPSLDVRADELRGGVELWWAVSTTATVSCTASFPHGRMCTSKQPRWVKTKPWGPWGLRLLRWSCEISRHVRFAVGVETVEGMASGTLTLVPTTLRALDRRHRPFPSMINWRSSLRWAAVLIKNVLEI
jgi:hypothetical protein